MKEDTKSLIDDIGEDRKAFRECIEVSKRSELETQRMSREYLDRHGSKTNKCTHIISQELKETEVVLTTDNQIMEKIVELINKGATEPVAERQDLSSELVNVDSVRSLDDQSLDQQIGIRHRSKLKKAIQGNGVSRKELIAVHTRVIRCAVPAVRKGNIRKRPGSESTASRIPQRKMHPEFNIGIDNRVARKQLQLKIQGTSDNIIRKPI
jgi:hypothetical protein